MTKNNPAPNVMRGRLKRLGQYVSTLQKEVDRYTDEPWNRGYEYAEVVIGKKLRDILSNPVPGFHAPNPSLKTRAKARFLQWRENQAKAEWKTLTEAEQALWEGYVSEGVEFGEIRARELAIDQEDAILDASYVFMEENIYLTAEDLHDEMSHLSFEDCQKIVGTVVASLKDVSGWEQ